MTTAQISRDDIEEILDEERSFMDDPESGPFVDEDFQLGDGHFWEPAQLESTIIFRSQVRQWIKSMEADAKMTAQMNG
jgi:hypothetical protein